MAGSWGLQAAGVCGGWGRLPVELQAPGSGGGHCAPCCPRGAGPVPGPLSSPAGLWAKPISPPCALPQRLGE